MIYENDLTCFRVTVASHDFKTKVYKSRQLCAIHYQNGLIEISGF